MAQLKLKSAPTVNAFSTTLNGSISSTDLTITLNSVTGLQNKAGILVLDRQDSSGTNTPTKREYIYFTSVSGSAVICPSTADGRGQSGSTAQSHSDGAKVEAIMDVDQYNGLLDSYDNQHNDAGTHDGITAATISAGSLVSISSNLFTHTLNAASTASISGQLNINRLSVVSAATINNLSQYGKDDGWVAGQPTPDTVTYNGNNNYSLVFNSTDLTSYISPGQKLKLTRTVTAPTQSTSLNGTTQYYSKASPNKMTFTDDFVVSAWVKLSSYAVGTIISRYNGTSGWGFYVTATGQLQLSGYNAGSANESKVTSYRSLPLNKWVHVAAQLDMSTFTATTTTSYIMIDGLDVTATVARAGTNPTALIQAGDLEVGASNGAASFFPGKIAQAAVYSAAVTQATIRASVTQGLVGTETSLASAYSFNNSIADLNTTTPNDLTANGSAVATNADSPFAGGVTAPYTAGTTEFGEVFNASFSTNTTLVVQCPDGYAIPTSGGVSALAYSTAANPLGWQNLGLVIGIAQIGSSATTTATSAAQVPGLSTTVYVPAGRKIRVSAFTEALYTNTNTVSAKMTIWDGTVGSGTQVQQAVVVVVVGAVQIATGMTASVILSPATGSKTYNVGFHAASAATTTLESGTTLPAYILVELI